jgi:hypothetical protein
VNRHRWITLAVAAANLLLVCLFPPFDYLSPARTVAPAFDGFGFAFGEEPNRAVNASFLQLELLVILANTAIAWLLLRQRSDRDPEKKLDWQKVVLFGVGLNLLLIVLFPPMENTYALTRSALPSFDGFYLLFGDHANHAIVTQLVYIEVFFVLINGALLYLLFRRSDPVALKPEALAALAGELRKSTGKQ